VIECTNNNNNNIYIKRENLVFSILNATKNVNLFQSAK